MCITTLEEQKQDGNMANLGAIGKLIDSVGSNADKLTESGEERQATLTERQRIDSTSPFKLPHLVRPIIALIALLLQVGVFVAAICGVILPEHIVYEIGALNTATIGFYFNSRRNEKINAKKTAAAIKIEKIKARKERKRNRNN